MVANWTIHKGDALEVLKTLESESVHCCVTSPPYFGLRDYGIEGQIGLELTPEDYVTRLVAVFLEVKRVLRPDGTLWLNLGDSYAGSWGNYGGQNRGKGKQRKIVSGSMPTPAWEGLEQYRPAASRKHPELKPKDLIGIPWMVAFALRSSGWHLRSDIIWHKPNPMPESVTDRPTKSHEYIFLLTKSQKYYYDADAIREPHKPESLSRYNYGLNVKAPADGFINAGAANPRAIGHCSKMEDNVNLAGRNKRSVWTVPTQSYNEAHFATFPPKLIEPCILAGCPEGGTVLDPFAGAGTTLLVADRLGRRGIGIELNPAYIEMAKNRIIDDAPLFYGTGD